MTMNLYCLINSNKNTPQLDVRSWGGGRVGCEDMWGLSVPGALRFPVNPELLEETKPTN